MTRNPYTTIFDHANPGHLEVKRWRGMLSGCTWQTAMRRYAMVHGEAKAWKANDSVIRFWNDGGTIRQRTYHNVLHVNA